MWSSKHLVCVSVLCVIINNVTSFPSFLFQSNQNKTKNEQSSSSDRKSKVLNFLPIPYTQECLSNDNRRTGLCQNPYECRIYQGEAHGQCALGFGVCCVYAATCGEKLSGNIGYFVSPGFPGALTPGSRDLHKECRLTIEKASSDMSQIRLDMVHFTLGQPNRRTGVCEQDQFILRAGNKSRALRMCGQNTGQHFYYDIEDVEDHIDIVIHLAKDHVSRFWEIKITQVEFQDRAPAGCLQYFTEEKGVVQTMNFADNGRHLADQDYNICIKQEDGMCSIVYEPCDKNSFKIGPSNPLMNLMNRPGGLFGQGPIAGNPNQPNQLGGASPLQGPLEAVEAEADPIDAEEGSGFGGIFGGFPLFGGSRSERQFYMNRECDDRIVMPCDSEDLIPLNQNGPGVCDLLHCGNSFCNAEGTDVGGIGPAACKIESSTLPFNIAVHFGPGLREENPEDNLGMCLRYNQQPC